jgi:hypothetical protein
LLRRKVNSKVQAVNAGFRSGRESVGDAVVVKGRDQPEVVPGREDHSGRLHTTSTNHHVHSVLELKLFHRARLRNFALP